MAGKDVYKPSYQRKQVLFNFTTIFQNPFQIIYVMSIHCPKHTLTKNEMHNPKCQEF